jgi:hypothetical protein
MSVKIRHHFCVIDGIRVEDEQRSTGERERERERRFDNDEATTTEVTGGSEVEVVGGGRLGFLVWGAWETGVL